MAGQLPDSTPGIRPAQWLDLLQQEQASPDFSIQLQLLTDEQMLSSAKGRVRRSLNQPSRGVEYRKKRNMMGESEGGSSSSYRGSVGSRETLDDGVASTNAETIVTRASIMSHRDPIDTDLSDCARSQGRSDINSVIGLDDASDVGTQPAKPSKKSKSSHSGGTQLTARALDELNSQNQTEPYNEIKRKLRKHLDKRRTGRIADESQGFPSCFHAGGLYDPRMGSVEIRLKGENAGRWHIWCATCNEGKLPGCPQCGESLAHSMGRGENGKKKARLMMCIACGVEVKKESVTTDPSPSCPGHYCYSKMPRDMWLVNPLQWGDVIAMLRGKCWWCHKWRMNTFELRRRVASLRLLNERLWTPGLEEVMDQRFAVSKWDATGQDKGKENEEAPRKKCTYTAAEADEAGIDLMRFVYEYIAEAEVTTPMHERSPTGSFFSKRREVVNDIWRLITSVPSGSACRHCGLANPKRITDFKKTAIFYDMSGKDMDSNIEVAQNQEGLMGHTSWASMLKELAIFKSETEINKGGGQVVHHKKDGTGRGKPMREAAPRGNVYLPPHKIKMHLEALFLSEQESLGEIFYQVCSSPGSVDANLRIPPKDYWKAFMHRIVELGPNKFRPFREGDDGGVQADDQTKQISNLLACSKNLTVIGSKLSSSKLKKEFSLEANGTPSSTLAFWKARPRTFEFVARSAQDSYRRIMFAQADSMGDKPGKGAQQIFEKKSGLFRTNLMGKRVNQACRSVISPDNAVEDNQVMLSRRFAKRLTIPEVLPSLARITRLEEMSSSKPHLHKQVTDLKTRRGFLYHSVLNGAKVYPGATRIEMDADDAKQVSEAFEVLHKERRPSWMTKALTVEDVQLIDVARMNGQNALQLLQWMEEVLHRKIVKEGASSGISSVRFKVFRHVATDDWVILNRQPTLHKSSWLGQKLVVATNERTIRFHYANCKGFNADFDGDEMNVHVPQTERAQMELRVLNHSRRHFISSTSGKPLRGLIQDHVVAGVLLTMRDTFLSGPEFDKLLYATLHKLCETMPPRPEPAVRVKKKQPDGSKVWIETWTGKQLITSILKFITAKYSKIGRYAGGVCFEGRTALPASVWDPRDKKPAFVEDRFMEDDQVEVIHDYYVRGMLDKNQLGATGGTLVQHVHEIHGEDAAGALICCFGRILTEYLKYYGFTVGICDLMLTGSKEDERAAKLRELDESIIDMETEGDRLGMVMRKTGDLNKQMFPKGMQKSFPHNCLAMMTMSGAKGSGVNSTQMAVLLGQQTFDGRRVECMPNGKTLPGTLLGDDRASCGGFGLGRFLSGIRPQQYVVHAAAGRDGLIDTAVKTSRSGYLQRSVIKGMEGLSTKWMSTTNEKGESEVRPAVVDEAGGIVQFSFGHDGLDPQRSAGWEAGTEPSLVEHHTMLAVANGLGSRNREWRSLPNEALQREQDTTAATRKRPGEVLLNGAKRVKLTSATGKESIELADKQKVFIKEGKAKPGRVLVEANGVTGYLKASNVKAVPTKILEAAVKKAKELRVMKAKMACDEPVGVIAAQSVGEPSTQMTLNTFHQAGQTVSHVTEGIPRLRQILQSASVSEPMVMLPVEKMTPHVAKALLRLHALLTPKPLSDVLAKQKWTTVSQPMGKGEKYKQVKVVLNLDEAKLRAYYAGEHGVVDSNAADKTAKKQQWEEFNSAYRREREAMGLLSMGITGSGVSTGRCMLRLGDRKISGAVGDLHTSLTSLNRAIMREVQRSWNWDKVHDTNGFDARMGVCDGDALQHEVDQPYNPGHRNDAEPNKTYVTPDGKTCEMKLLAFDDITGYTEKKTSSLSLSSTSRYFPYSAKEEYRTERNAGDQNDLPERPELAKEASKTLNSLNISINPQGVCRSQTPGILQYHFTITLPLHVNLMFDDLLQRALNEIILRKAEIGGIKSVFFVPNQKGTGGVFHLDGGKIKQLLQVMHKFSDFPDIDKAIRFDKVRSTDHSDMVNTFGVEAGQAGLLEELKKLFKSYGVNSRWLSLVTDRAMFTGSWKGFSRFSVIANSPSILSRMTFETATKFLASATKEGLLDDMKSPAARIIFGQELSKSSSSFASKASRNLVGEAPLKRAPVYGQAALAEDDEDFPVQVVESKPKKARKH
eukprot:TRINITY_DN4438_c0_g2_i2.p1 TRINITY_DN4438_c0_g2~~TRINITY_DN4438_c0_g2_i2.p1  ORF type:complete len:2132 (+),score=607.99 TRINITY_DN4438_c0_g2_i2:66-6398(+)